MNERNSLKHLKCWLAVITFLVVFPGPLRAAEYVIGYCDVLIELIRDYQEHPRDADITLEITYEILRGSKVEDFKLVGTLPITNVSVFDENKKPISTKFELKHKTREKQHKISWEFYGAPQTKKTIYVTFILRGALKGTLEENRLKFDWLNKWNYPVSEINYRFVLPVKKQFKIIHSEPVKGEIVHSSGSPAFEMYTENLTSENFEIRFSPGIAMEAPAQPGDPVKGGIGFFTIVIFVILGAVLGWFFFKLDIISFKGGESSRRLLKWRRRF